LIFCIKLAYLVVLVLILALIMLALCFAKEEGTSCDALLLKRTRNNVSELTWFSF